MSLMFLYSKPPTQTPKLKTMQKLILSYVHNVLHLIDQLTASETLVLAVTETSKLIPYITSSKKTVKSYLKVTFFDFYILFLK